MRLGVGFRTELAADLMAAPRSVDFVEIVAETCFTQRQARREAQALAEIWPVIPHGVKLSLGTAAGIDDSRVHRLARENPMLHQRVLTEPRHHRFYFGDVQGPTVAVKRGHLVWTHSPLPRRMRSVRRWPSSSRTSP